MPEREFNFKKQPELIEKQDSFLAERLALSFLGRQRFAEAVTILAYPDIHPHNEESVKVAKEIASVGFSVDPIINVLYLKAQQEDDKHTQNYRAMEIAKISVLSGDYSTYYLCAPLVDRPANVHLFAAQIQTERDQDPAIFLKKAEAVTLEDAQNDQDNFGVRQVINYMHIGEIYAKANSIDEAKRAFRIAEGIINIARASRKPTPHLIGKQENVGRKSETVRKAEEITNYETYYNDFVKSYAKLGWWDDASRVTQILKEDDSSYFSSAIEVVTQKQLKHGLVDEAVQTANQLGGPLYFKALANKAVADAKKGDTDSYKQISSELEQIIENGSYDPRFVDYEEQQAKKAWPGGNIYAVLHHMSLASESLNPDDYVLIRSLLGEAASSVGDVERAKEHFQKALAITDEEESELKPAMLLTIARSVDNSGFEAMPLFEEVFKTAQALVPETATDWEQAISQAAQCKWSVWSGAIEELNKRGYFQLTHRVIDEYNIPHYPGSRARLLASMGTEEINAGLSSAEIANLTTEDIDTIMKGNNQVAKQALFKFGLTI